MDDEAAREAAQSILGRTKTASEEEILKANLRRWPFGGFTGSRERLEALTEQKIDPAYFDHEPTGTLVFIVEEKPPESFGPIKLNPGQGVMGGGYVMAVGPEAGKRQPGALAIGPQCPEPWMLLYKHVTVAATAGTPVRVSVLDRRYRAQALMVSCRDILTIDHNPTTWKSRAEKGPEATNST